MSSMKDKIAIVTGASSGIGLAACKELLALDASVLGVDIAAEHDSLKEDPRFKFHQCDLTSPEAAITVVSACATTFHTPRIDALLNVAGIMDNFAAIDKFEDAAWERVMAINLTAPARLMRAVIKVMRPQKSGAILNVSSAAGESGAMAGCAYTASKHGLNGLTKNTAWRFRDEGIRCNAILPGGVETNIFSTIGDPSKMDAETYQCMSPVMKLGVDLEAGKKPSKPETVAKAIAYLVSDASKGVSGALIPIDNALCAI